MSKIEKNTALVLDAAAFAAQRHSTQRRKDAAASPYINHPLAVAQLIANVAQIDDPEILAAALLHDTLEDTDISAEELAERFGTKVAAFVQEVSDDKSLSKDERKRLQVVNASHHSREAQVIKIADKICNLTDIAQSPPMGWDLKRRQDYFEWAKAVVDQIRDASPELSAAFDLTYALAPKEEGAVAPTRGELEGPYNATHFRVSDYPHNFTLRIGQASSAAQAILWDQSADTAIFITAYNPFSQPQDAAVNEAAQAKLRLRLDELGASAVLQGEGVDPSAQWPGEPSFLAVGLSREVGAQLAKDFGQHAFVLVERDKAPALVWNQKL